MARIKLVLNERRLAYEGARKIAEEQAAKQLEEDLTSATFDDVDSQILKYQLGKKPLKSSQDEKTVTPHAST